MHVPEFELRRTPLHPVLLSHSAVQEALTVVLHKHARLAGQLRERSFADPWVVALAKAPGYSVLSEELRKGKPDQPRIPFVCDDFGIPIVRIVDLIRREGWVFRS
jgi:Domain of unknown function (DUF4411)